MQDTNKYISGLLFIHDCVILPGFGGFVCNYKSAGHNEDNHTFTPPKKDIIFNRHLTYNDGLLINYLAKNQNVSYAEAEEIIRDEVQKAWLKLDKGEDVYFEGVGTFSYDNNNQLCFMPSDSENFLTDSYGLGSFRFPPLSYQKKTVDFVPKYNQESMNHGLKQTLKWAAIALPIAGIIALFPYYNKHKQQQAGISITAIADSGVKIQESIENSHSASVLDKKLQEDNNSLMDTDKRTALFYSPQKTTLEKKQKTEGKTFYIIGGSYKEKSNAAENSAKYKADGFNEVEILEVDGLYRVSIVKYSDKLTALHELRRLRGDNNMESVWLYSK